MLYLCFIKWLGSLTDFPILSFSHGYRTLFDVVLNKLFTLSYGRGLRFSILRFGCFFSWLSMTSHLTYEFTLSVLVFLGALLCRLRDIGIVYLRNFTPSVQRFLLLAVLCIVYCDSFIAAWVGKHCI